MTKINMSELAKKVAREGENWVSYMDTYGQISPKEVAAKDAAGFDLVQLVDGENNHLGFEWEPRVAIIYEDDFTVIFTLDGAKVSCPAVEVKSGYTVSGPGCYSFLGTWAVAIVGWLDEDGEFDYESYTVADAPNKGVVGWPKECEGWDLPEHLILSDEGEDFPDEKEVDEALEGFYDWAKEWAAQNIISG